MSSPRDDSDATVGPDGQPLPESNSDQTLDLPEMPKTGSDQTLEVPAMPRSGPSDLGTQVIAGGTPALDNHEQIVIYDSLQSGGSAEPANDRTLAHDSLFSVDPSAAASDQTMAHDSMAPVDQTIRKQSGWKTAGGVKLSLSSKAGSFVTPGEVEPLPEFAEEVPGYELLGELGRGAMGVVYKARQVGLKRIVALKMILSGGRASQAELHRFRTEAEAVARLQHPYIVQVFEIGEHQGLPFFSLEFVEGGCLADKIAENPMPLREAAELVRKLAEGMACAHENGIIHRDLKPANVLLTREGDPKITDFGLAKKLEEDSGATRVGAIMGTPSYMAPEQAEGRNDLIGPHSDIYALGAILYDLITGRPPFRGATLLETLTQVRTAEPVSPARLHPKMPHDLETITLKCLQKEPKKRYHTARDLVEDLRRFLAGEPILARPVSPLERSWKWCKRNPAAAALIAVSALSLLAIAAGGVAYARSETLRAEEAERLRQEADSQRDRAQEHFRQARAAVDEMLSRVGQEQLGYEPRMEQVRRDLLEKAAAFYDRFMQLESADPSVRQEAARAARKVGDARALLGQQAEAEQAYRRSLELLDAVLQEAPQDVAARQDLAAATNNLANQLRVARRFDEADALSARAIELYRQLADEAPEDRVRQRELALAYYNRSLLEQERGKIAEAAVNLLSARQLQQKLLTLDPNELQTREELARTYNAQGALQMSSRVGEAEQNLLEALSLYQGMAKQYPKNARVREGLLDTTSKLGELLRTSRPSDAGPLLRRAVELGRQLVADYPTVPDYQRQLASARTSLGVWQLADGRRAAAKLSFDQALQDRQRLTQNFPLRPDFQRELASAEGVVALQLLTAGLSADAAPLCRRSVETLRKLIKDHPGQPADERELALALVRLATVEPNNADKLLREALTIQERLVQREPRSREYRAELAATVSALGAMELAQGKPQEAETLLARGEADYRELIKNYSTEPDYRFGLASVRINQAEQLKSMRKLAEAEVALREAIELLDALAKEYATQSRFAREQGKALHNLGWLLIDSKRHADAEKLLQQALTLREGLARQYATEPSYRQDQAATLGALAVAQTFRNNLTGAERTFQQAIELLNQLRQQQPSEIAILRDLAREQQNFARFLFALGREEEAIQRWRQAIGSREALAKLQGETLPARVEVADSIQQLALALLEARRWDEARTTFREAASQLRQAWKQAPEHPALPAMICQVELRAAEAALGNRDAASAAKAIAEAPLNGNGAGQFLPIAAATLARCAALATDKPNEAKTYADRAMELLRKAHTAGFKDAEALKKANEFDALRKREDFNQLLREMAGN